MLNETNSTPNPYNKKYLLIHVGKSGGGNLVTKITTQKCAIIKVKNKTIQYSGIKNLTGGPGGEREVVNDPNEAKLGYIHTHNLNQQDISQILDYCDEYVVLCRDPATRFISIFNAIKQYPNHIDSLSISKFETPNELAEALSIEHKLYNMAIKAVLNGNPHFMKGISHYLVNEETIKRNIKKFKYIIKFDDYKNDFSVFYQEILKNIIDIPFESFFKNIVHETKKFTNNQHLSQTAKKNLKNIFKQDYDIFNCLVKYNIIEKEWVDTFI